MLWFMIITFIYRSNMHVLFRPLHIHTCCRLVVILSHARERFLSAGSSRCSPSSRLVAADRFAAEQFAAATFTRVAAFSVATICSKYSRCDAHTCSRAAYAAPLALATSARIRAAEGNCGAGHIGKLGRLKGLGQLTSTQCGGGHGINLPQQA